MSTPSPWQVQSIEAKVSAVGKNYTAIKLKDQSGAEIKTSLWNPVPNLVVGCWINAVIEKSADGKYWNTKGAVNVINQTQHVLSLTPTGISVLPPPIILPTTIANPKNDQPKIISNDEQWVYDQIVEFVTHDEKTQDDKIIAQNELDTHIQEKVNEFTITRMAALKMFASDNKIVLKPTPTPESKEQMMTRMAKERDAVNRELIDVLKCLCVRIKALEDKLDLNAVMPKLAAMPTEGAKK